MSTVWRAENTLVRKQVAIKIMRPEFARNPATVGRFRNEATSAGRIGNDHICDILDLGEADLGLYIVMEMLRGQSFSELLDDQGSIDHGLAVLIMRQALTGLAAAHDAGIVHRDLKPDNVFLHEPTPGRLLVKLMDFGISKFTQDATAEAKTAIGVIMGTPEYMSPEQAEGAANVDARGDIWAVGVMLYHAIIGKNPFGANTLAATIAALMTRDPEPVHQLKPSVPQGLSDVIMRCLAKKPADRYASVAELSRELEAFDQAPASGGTLAFGSATAATHVASDETMSTPTRSTPPRSTRSGTQVAIPAGDNAHPGPSVATPASVSAAPAPSEASGAHRITAAPPPRQTGGTWSGELGGVAAVEDGWDVPGSPPHAGAQLPPQRPLARSNTPLFALIGSIMVIGLGYLGVTQLGGGDSEANAPELAPTESAPSQIAPEGTMPPSDRPPDSSRNPDAEGANNGAQDVARPVPNTNDADQATSKSSKKSGSKKSGSKQSSSKKSGSKKSGSKQSGSKQSGTKTPKIQTDKLVASGSLFTPKALPALTSFNGAKSRCNKLGKSKHAGLSTWRLATPSQVLSFKRSAIRKVKYWSNKQRGTSATTVNLMAASSKNEAKTTKARPFCVAPRRRGSAGGL